MPPRKPPREPTDCVLHDAALAHLARFGTTKSGLLRVLDRKVARWAALTGGDPGPGRAAARGVVERLVASGAVNDQVFAEVRARSLVRSGRSVRAVGAHLASKGVASSLAAAALPEGVDELGAAAVHARKRRLGPWRKMEDAPPEVIRRELGSFARAGFGHDVARRVLALGQDEAEALIVAFRAGL